MINAFSFIAALILVINQKRASNRANEMFIKDIKAYKLQINSLERYHDILQEQFEEENRLLNDYVTLTSKRSTPVYTNTHTTSLFWGLLEFKVTK